MKLFMMIVVLLVAACSNIDAEGKYCSNKNNANCEVYIPVISPVKMFLKGGLGS